MADRNRRNEDPVEGSRETVERELKRTAQRRKGTDSGKRPASEQTSERERPGDRQERQRQSRH